MQNSRKTTTKGAFNPSWDSITTLGRIRCEQNYDVVIDYYSNYIEVDRLNDTSSKKLIHVPKQQFERFGISEIIVSDNGSQFASGKLKEFLREMDFRHSTSSPGHTQSNWKVVNAVKTAKNLLKRQNMQGQILSLQYWIEQIYQHSV